MADRPLEVERFPAELRRRLRIQAAVHGMTMRQIILDGTDSLVTWLEENGPETPPTIPPRVLQWE